jgi:hypothetical protein
MRGTTLMRYEYKDGKIEEAETQMRRAFAKQQTAAV